MKTADNEIRLIMKNTGNIQIKSVLFQIIQILSSPNMVPSIFSEKQKRIIFMRTETLKPDYR